MIPITLPRSKSIVIRCLIVNYLRTGVLLPVYDNDSNDIKVVHTALKAIDLQKKNRVEERYTIDVEDCGTAYRFLMAILSTTPGKWLLTGRSRLLERPIMPLVKFLIEHGASIVKTKKGWNIDGKELQIDHIEIDSTETSQYGSAVLMIMGKSKSENLEKTENENPYIRMTESILRISCSKTLGKLTALSDWSAAAFWIADALLKQNVRYLLKYLHFDNLQGDAEIVQLCSTWGLAFTEKEYGIEIERVAHIDIPEQQIDVSHTPDIAMILATLAVCYPFELTLRGLKNLNLKESKRLDIIVGELSKFTTVEKHSEESVTIHRRIKILPEIFHFDSYNDHRFVMAWSLFRNFGNVNIKNSDCIKKSYPFFAPVGLNQCPS